MNFQNRKAAILNALDAHDSLDVKALVELLGASEITIRRDLVQLAASGLLIRTRGGAMRVGADQRPFQFANKTALNVAQKTYIAQLAANEIEDGDVIFMDCGSTVFRLCEFIRGKRITVITNSLPVVGALLNSDVKINLVGGEIDQQRQAVHGLIAEQHISHYRASRAFIGVDGISLATGLTANSEAEASTATAMAVHAERVYLLADSSKLERESYLQFAPLTLFNVLITDNQADAEVIERYRQAGISVITS
jgi:DeoR family transcriptional regulator, fructose operon transcriptional repressor